eukprot:CAMPEP_0171599908 /NCGR_PEP_ID=MMETSP0990-20121206/4012_1 /TAXON_ID=483369 /ORGANISM="non described non described, Strain CCMP2098" /LENGTH=206 /DNA_ID=CAMNT_0012161773 /DNA_START=397 /DNA_END=1014 /DNA_ORIENTATION=+
MSYRLLARHSAPTQSPPPTNENEIQFTEGMTSACESKVSRKRKTESATCQEENNREGDKLILQSKTDAKSKRKTKIIGYGQNKVPANLSLSSPTGPTEGTRSVRGYSRSGGSGGGGITWRKIVQVLDPSRGFAVAAVFPSVVHVCAALFNESTTTKAVATTTTAARNDDSSGNKAPIGAIPYRGHHFRILYCQSPTTITFEQSSSQ